MTLPTPYLELDPDVLADRYLELTRTLPGTRVHYAVKANPHPLGARHPGRARVTLRRGQSGRGGGRRCRRRGPLSIALLQPHQAPADIAEAYQRACACFAVDTMGETEKVADCAPGSSVLCRLLTTGEGSDWPLSRKYGALPDEAVLMLDAAANLGLDPAGVTFHVGSQQRDPAAWRRPIGEAEGVSSDSRSSSCRWRVRPGEGCDRTDHRLSENWSRYPGERHPACPAIISPKLRLL